MFRSLVARVAGILTMLTLLLTFASGVAAAPAMAQGHAARSAHRQAARCTRVARRRHRGRRHHHVRCHTGRHLGATGDLAQAASAASAGAKPKASAANAGAKPKASAAKAGAKPKATAAKGSKRTGSKTTGTSAIGTTPTAPVPAASNPIANTFGRAMFGVAAGGALQNEAPAQLATDLGADQAVGSKWLRVDINWAQIQNQGPASYDWTVVDAVVQAAEARGMNVLGVIVYTPSWARPTGTDPTYSPDPAAYARFAQVAAAHYGAMGVHAYEIWNEENSQLHWTPAPSAAAYAAVLKGAYPAIHAGDPSATVVTGGLSPDPSDGTNIAPVDFLKGVYAAGAQGSFDAVGAHPYCWPAMPGAQETWSAWYQMYGTATSLRSLMVANGDGAKKIWATEFGAPTNGPAGSSFVTPATQALMVAAAFKAWSGYSWAGPLFIYQGRDQGTDTSTIENFFGFINHDGTPKPAFAAYRAAVTAS